MRGVFVFIVLVAVAATSVHALNYTFGVRQFNDRLLTREFVVASSKFARIVTVDMQYPNKTMPANRSVINYMQIVDQKEKDNGGYATLTRGGIGFNHTGIHFKSQRNHGIRFMIDIYGIN